MPHDTAARLESLLAAWQEAREAGRDVPAADLCRDCPELLPEVENRLDGLRVVYGLLAPESAGPETTTNGQTYPPGPRRGADPLPETIGGYRVVRLLGKGGMGQVLEAEDTRLGRRIAVKVMRPDLARDAAARGRFLREARAAAALSHDHVVPIFQVGEDGDVPFIAMPLLAGESLEARLHREGALPVAEVVRIGREVALGLAAAHEKGLVHRDVKPANLWLEGEPGASATGGRVKILDFGLARQQTGSDGLTQPGAVMGTPAYMSPEQVNGEPVDARSDLFSLGCVLYRAATGKPAFEGKTLTALLRDVAEGQPAAPREVRPDVPRGLSDLILRLLAKRPADRPASAADVAASLVGEACRGSATWTMPRRWRRAVAAVGLLAVVAAGWWALQGPAARKGDATTTPATANPPARYRGQIDVLIEREVEPGAPPRLVRLDDPRALPMRRNDQFRIEAKVVPAAYLYVVWVDPGKDVTPVYPWDAAKGWGSRPTREAPVAKVGLPPTAGDKYRVTDPKPGVVTMVLLARPTPLDVPDDEVRGWFEMLPDLPLPPGGERGVAWFDNYVAVTNDASRPRAFEVVGAADPFAKWQGMLQKAVGGRAAFQTAVSFARTGGK